MKRIFSLVLLVAAIASTAFAADHYSFMGVPMDGRISQFCNKLVSQKGLKIVERDDERGVYTLSGRFAGYTNCEFYVFDNDNTKQVYQVDVYLPEQSTWNSIKTQYNKIVRDYRSNAAYTFKSSTSDFESPYRDGGGDEVAAVKDEKVDYSTTFIADGGVLLIKISRYMQVKLSFMDVENYPSDDDEPIVDNSSAMTFMGIPMRGNISSFAQQLVNQKGFRIVNRSAENHSISMRGTYTGKECEVYVFGSQVTDQVWSINVYLPELSTWNAIKREYLNYKGQFDNKYTLTSSYDFFADPYDEGDGDEIAGVKADKCHYAAFYDAPGGSIMLKISKYMQVEVSYEDAVNRDIAEREENGTSSGSGNSYNDI